MGSFIPSASSSSPSFTDTLDFTNASRGHIASLKPCIIRTSTGRICWDNDSFSFLHDDDNTVDSCPTDTANPKLWRQGQLNSLQGLYEVVPDAVYQIRGFDLSVMTIIEGARGVIIVDPLVSCECSAAGLGLYRRERCGKGKVREGKGEVVGMLYSHSHGDHYMGALGVLPEWRDDGTGVQKEGGYDFPIVAPEGFMSAVMSESILAGPAMRQRAAYMYGRALPRNAKGHIGVGLAQASSTGTTSLVPPNVSVGKTGEELVIDGVRVVFQMVPDSEAPAEFNFYLPQFQALCMAETATNCLHNVVTLRGAQVRNAKAWSGYLDEALVRFGQRSVVMFQSHHWPVWGVEEVKKRLATQRDLYAYIHDQTVRQMNMGYTGIEIAETLKMPPGLSREWHTQGFYGSVSHNVKGVYQKYMTWFDGKAESLWRHPPKEEGLRYVECFGGVDPLCDKAEEFAAKGDLRFASTLLSHARAASPDHERVKASLATVFERLGYGAENATWRNFYLTTAQDLRTGQYAGMVAGGGVPLGPSLTVEQWFDVLAVQLDGEAAGEKKQLVIDVGISDEARRWRVVVSNGVLTHRTLGDESSTERDGYDGAVEGKADLTLVVKSKMQLLEALRGNEVGWESCQGDRNALRELLALTAVAEGSKRGQSQL